MEEAAISSNAVPSNSGYDSFDRLTNFARDVLSASGNNGTILHQIDRPGTTNNCVFGSLGKAR